MTKPAAAAKLVTLGAEPNIDGVPLPAIGQQVTITSMGGDLKRVTLDIFTEGVDIQDLPPHATIRYVNADTSPDDIIRHVRERTCQAGHLTAHDASLLWQLDDGVKIFNALGDALGVEQQHVHLTAIPQGAVTSAMLDQALTAAGYGA